MTADLAGIVKRVYLTPCPGARDDEAMRHRSVVIVAFEDVQGLDVFGPADVFYFANYLAAMAGHPCRRIGIGPPAAA